MSLSSQGLRDDEKRDFRKIRRAAKARGAGNLAKFDRKLGRITTSVVSGGSAASSRIAAKIRREIIDPFRQRQGRQR